MNKEIPIDDHNPLDELEYSFISESHRSEIASLGRDKAKVVERYVLKAYTFMESDPNQAEEYAKKAAQIGSRLAIVREVLGIAAYKAGDYKLAISELRTARRMNGHNDYLPLLADSFRGLGQPEKVLEITENFKEQIASLDNSSHVEMAIVLAGAYADKEHYDQALSILAGETKKSGLGSDQRIRLEEARATIYELKGDIEAAESIWKNTEPARLKSADIRVPDLVVFDLLEEDDIAPLMTKSMGN